MLSLTQMCQLSGASRRTLQGYDKLGLLRHRRTTPGGYWLYSESDLERLSVIQLLRRHGFSRRELVEIIPDQDLPLEELLESIRASLLLRCHRLELLLSQLDPARIRGIAPMPVSTEEEAEDEETL